jgi:hypothetical protein
MNKFFLSLLVSGLLLTGIIKTSTQQTLSNPLFIIGKIIKESTYDLTRDIIIALKNTTVTTIKNSLYPTAKIKIEADETYQSYLKSETIFLNQIRGSKTEPPSTDNQILHALQLQLQNKTDCQALLKTYIDYAIKLAAIVFSITTLNFKETHEMTYGAIIKNKNHEAPDENYLFKILIEYEDYEQTYKPLYNKYIRYTRLLQQALSPLDWETINLYLNTLDNNTITAAMALAEQHDITLNFNENNTTTTINQQTVATHRKIFFSIAAAITLVWASSTKTGRVMAIKWSLYAKDHLKQLLKYHCPIDCATTHA